MALQPNEFHPDPSELTDRAIDRLRNQMKEYVDDRSKNFDAQLEARTDLLNARFELVTQQFGDVDKASAILAERVRETSEFHAAAHEREHNAHQREHVLTEAALGKADTSLDKRLDAMNGFRGQLSDQSQTFVTKEVLEAHRTDVLQRISRNTVELEVLRAQNERLQGILSVARFLGVGGIAIAVASLVLAFTGS